MIVQRPVFPNFIQSQVLTLSYLIESDMKSRVGVQVWIRCRISRLQLQMGMDMRPKACAGIASSKIRYLLWKAFLKLVIVRIDTVPGCHALV